MALKTTYANDVLDVSMDGKRRYNMIENEDGTVTLEDATTYTSVGDEYGATQINEQNTTINNISDSLANLVFHTGDTFTLGGDVSGYVAFGISIYQNFSFSFVLPKPVGNDVSGVTCEVLSRSTFAKHDETTMSSFPTSSSTNAEISGDIITVTISNSAITSTNNVSYKAVLHLRFTFN